MQAGDLVGEFLQGAAAEDDAAGTGIVFEGFHDVGVLGNASFTVEDSCLLNSASPHPTAIRRRRCAAVGPWGLSSAVPPELSSDA